MFRVLKKITFWFFGILFSLILIGTVLGYLFRDKIREYVLNELGKKLNARIELQTTDLSFLKSWPDVRAELGGLSINPREKKKKSASGDFIFVEEAHVLIDFWSLFGDKYRVKQIKLYNPSVKMKRNSAGVWNFGDVFQVKKDSTAKESSVEFDLAKVKLSGGAFTLEDETGHNEVKLDSVAATLGGGLSGQGTDVNADLAFHLGKWTASGLPLFAERHIESKLGLVATFGKEESYTLSGSTLRIASLMLDLKGAIERAKEGYQLDLSFASAQSSFASFISLLPANLLNTGREYEYDGAFTMKGTVKGLAGPGKIPVIDSDFQVSNGRFQYTGYKAQLRDVNLNGNFSWDKNAAVAGRLRIDGMRAHLNQKEVRGSLLFEHFKDPRIDLKVYGDVSLQDVQEFYPSFADSSNLSGDVFLDIKASGKLDDFRNKRYNFVTAEGRVNFDGVHIEDKRISYPVKNLTGDVEVNNSVVLIRTLSGAVGQSDFEVSGDIRNYLPWFFTRESGEELVLNLSLHSKKINLNEWIVKDQKAQEKEFEYKLPKNVRAAFNAVIGDFELGKFKAGNVQGSVWVREDEIRIHGLDMQALGGSVSVAGQIKIASPEMVYAGLSLTSAGIDLKQGCNTFEQLAAFALVKENLTGTLALGTMNLSCSVNNKMEIDPAQLYVTAKGRVSEARLQGFKPLEAMAGFVKVEKLRDVKFSATDFLFRIEGQRFYITTGEMMANDYKMTVSGDHGFDNTLNYKVVVELPGREVKLSSSKKVQDWVTVNQDAASKARVVLPIIIRGTVDNPEFSLEYGDLVHVGKEVQRQAEKIEEGFKEDTQVLFQEKDTSDVNDWISVTPRDTLKKKGPSFLDKVKNPFRKKEQ